LASELTGRLDPERFLVVTILPDEACCDRQFLCDLADLGVRHISVQGERAR
jgi:hypothetical protein